jgi:hypothetical protein
MELNMSMRSRLHRGKSRIPIPIKKISTNALKRNIREIILELKNDAYEYEIWRELEKRDIDVSEAEVEKLLVAMDEEGTISSVIDFPEDDDDEEDDEDLGERYEVVDPD